MDPPVQYSVQYIQYRPLLTIFQTDTQTHKQRSRSISKYGKGGSGSGMAKNGEGPGPGVNEFLRSKESIFW